MGFANTCGCAMHHVEMRFILFLEASWLLSTFRGLVHVYRCLHPQAARLALVVLEVPV